MPGTAHSFFSHCESHAARDGARSMPTAVSGQEVTRPVYGLAITHVCLSAILHGSLLDNGKENDPCRARRQEPELVIRFPPKSRGQYKSPGLNRKGDKAGASIFGRAARYTRNIPFRSLCPEWVQTLWLMRLYAPPHHE